MSHRFRIDKCKSPFINRFTLLGVIASVLFSYSAIAYAAPAQVKSPSKANEQLAKLEKNFGGRIGLFALNTADGSTLGYRASEKFPFCSTFKVMVAAAILKKSEQMPGLLQRRIHYRSNQLAEHSPITEKHVAAGMTIADLCAAAIQYSDNTAANLLIQTLGSPKAVTSFARSIGDTQFRLDRWETALNTAIPGDARDTTTPAVMGQSLQRLLLGNALQPQSRQQLKTWLLGNTTGAERIKAGIPTDWKIGDKTGTGSYGTANDIAIVLPPKRAPIIIAIYTTRPHKSAEARSDVIASSTRIVVDWLAKK